MQIERLKHSMNYLLSSKFTLGKFKTAFKVQLLRDAKHYFLNIDNLFDGLPYITTGFVRFVKKLPKLSTAFFYSKSKIGKTSFIHRSKYIAELIPFDFVDLSQPRNLQI